MSERYDVFISYRREGGSAHARNVQLALKDMHSFLDFDELEDGKFDQRIMDAIEEAPTFLIILTDGALDRCVNEDDWVRKEILYAHQLGKHIIPVEVNKCYHEKTDTIPESVREIVGAHQFSPLDTESLFKDCINKLIIRIGNNEDFEGKIVRHEGAEVHFEVDYPCWISRFGKELLLAKPEEADNLAYLKKGKHKLEFKAVDFPNVKEVRVVEIPDTDMSEIVEMKLKAKVDKERVWIEQERIKKEEEARRIEKEKERRRREEEERERIKKEREVRGELNVGGVVFKMIFIEGGTFMMGATVEQEDNAWDDEKPAHRVVLDDYYIGETVVTQALWKAVMGDNPSIFEGDDCPVECVSWNDVTQKFIPELNRMTGLTFRLPTEAEWEFAARGGNKSKGYKYSGSDDINEVAWYWKNSGDSILEGSDSDWRWDKIEKNNSKIHSVKGKKPNELGLYDMSGNVWEWCKDVYGDYSGDPQVNPGRDIEDQDSGQFRVCRGGNWHSSEDVCCVAFRARTPSFRCNGDLGFRLVLDVDLPQEEKN